MKLKEKEKVKVDAYGSQGACPKASGIMFQKT